MNEINYTKLVLSNPRVLGYALLSASKKVLFLMLIIGAPSIYFSFKSEWYNQIALFLALSLIILVPYFLTCLVINKGTLTSKEDIEKFNTLSDREKGEQIGDELSGLW